jgi:hypothetical protein
MKLSADLRGEASAALGQDAPSTLAQKAEEQLESLTPKTNTALTKNGSGLSSHGHKQGTLTALVGQTARINVAAQGDAALVKLMCGIGIAPSSINAPEWIPFFHALNPLYDGPSREDLEYKLIPSEAQYCREQRLKMLRTLTNLTISADGGSNRGHRSFYTVHISTLDRDQHFMEARDSTGVKHSATWLKDEVLRVGHVLHLFSP